MISPAFARHRRIKCTLAWTLAFAVLSVALFSTVRYEPVLARGKPSTRLARPAVLRRFWPGVYYARIFSHALNMG
jgi:hypothetical protein